MNNGITVSYPRTSYKLFNDKTYLFIKKEIDSFMEIAKVPIQDNVTYTLDIVFDEYNYKNYLSTIFYISALTGGANSVNNLYSIIYDTKNKEFITIDSLINYNPNLLKKLRDLVRKKLVNNKKIVNKEMFLEGTEPIKDNYKYFTFAPTGLMLYFPQRQIAPYSSGIFKLVIPYQELVI